MGDVLFALLLLKLALGVLLVVCGSIVLGRKLGDVRFQQANKLNGIRRIQAWVNVRTQANRALLGLLFVLVSITLLSDMDITIRVLVSRFFDNLIALVFLASIWLDWKAEDKQLDIIHDEEYHA